jgi:hypothetical protein
MGALSVFYSRGHGTFIFCHLFVAELRVQCNLHYTFSVLHTSVHHMLHLSAVNAPGQAVALQLASTLHRAFLYVFFFALRRFVFPKTSPHVHTLPHDVLCCLHGP